jgi:uncharacterized protein with von Willebrand factor type A (vWA) domain
MINRQTSLSRNIVQFCRFLRTQGFIAGIEEESLSLSSLALTQFESKKVFYDILRAILCRNKSELDSFDNLYEEYWKTLDLAVDSKKIISNKNINENKKRDPIDSTKIWLFGKNSDNAEDSLAQSSIEKYSKKDFSKLNSDEIEEMVLIMKSAARRMFAKQARRKEISPNNYVPDLKRTLRKNLRIGGELLHIVHKRPKRNKSKLILICDTSRSMELYTAFLIRFMYAFQQAYRRMETFIFSTSIHRVTSLMKGKNFSTVRKLLSDETNLWSDGTRIGESLDLFVMQFGKKLIDSRTQVIIISDGVDTSGVEKIESSMAYIHQKAKKTIWLNPLASFDGYKPEVAGMRSALPYIDKFAPINNLENLRELIDWLTC